MKTKSKDAVAKSSPRHFSLWKDGAATPRGEGSRPPWVAVSSAPPRDCWGGGVPTRTPRPPRRPARPATPGSWPQDSSFTMVQSLRHASHFSFKHIVANYSNYVIKSRKLIPHKEINFRNASKRVFSFALLMQRRRIIPLWLLS